MAWLAEIDAADAEGEPISNRKLCVGGVSFVWVPEVMKLSKQKMMKAIVLTLLLLAGATVFASRSQQQEPREARDKAILPENYLPEGEARDVIFQACVQCHDLRNTVSQRKTAAAWKRTVDEMIWRGAPLMADEAETITKYLAASFGPDKPIPEELKKKSTGSKH